MSVEMVLNELSYSIPAQDIYAARKWISMLRKTVQAATDRGIKRVLRTDRPIYGIQIAPNYSIANWLHDDIVNKDERNFIYVITTKTPFQQDFLPTDSNDTAELTEFFFMNEIANGLRYAYWMNNLAVSFLSNSKWDIAVIDNIIVQGLDAMTGDFVEQQTVSVNHASRPEHLDNHASWISDSIQDTIIDGHDIWYRKEELYPNLQFCNSVRRQLNSLYSSHYVFRQVKERLSELEKNYAYLSQRGFNPENLRGNPRQESGATLNQYGNERTFLCPDGQTRIFSWHVSINPGVWRLYFFPLDNERKIIIGYIGKHLSVVTDN